MTDTEHALWIANLRWDDLPGEVRRQATLCLTDILATAAGSLQLPTSGQFADLVTEQYGPGDVPLWFQDRGSSSVGAAYFNCQCVDSLDCHDGFRPNKGHAGATVAPVLIGAAAQVGADLRGRDLLTALVVGYEIALRAGLAVHALYAPHYHASGSWASPGGAAAGAKLIGLPAEQIDGALGMTEYYAPMSPMLRCTDHPSVVKDAAGPGGWAAAMALAMTRRGMVGLPSIFSAEPLGREQAATLGQEWLILKQYFKPCPTCRWAQPALEGLKQLQAEHGFEAADVERIDIETFACAADLMHFPPEHTDAAQYSLPWAVAAQLVDGALGVEQIHPDRLRDATILAAGRRVYTKLAPDLEARFPEEALARTTVTLTDGRVLTSPTMAAHGDWTDPLSSEELALKADTLMVGGLGQKRAKRLLDVLGTLTERPVRDLLATLR